MWNSCHRCGFNPCRCHQTVNICDPCNTNTGCPIQLDFDCVIYHKDNNEVTNLTCLELTNGATLNQFAEAVDAQICQLNVEDYNLPCLRADYTINTLAQFANAVDTEICILHDDIETLTGLVSTPITPVDTTSIDLSVSGLNSHTLSASLIVAPNADNQLTVLPAGAYVAPQTLTIDYDTQEICISDGNCVDLSPMLCTAEGFRGNIAADPVDPEEGQYWYNTVENELRIQVNNAVYTITITAV